MTAKYILDDDKNVIPATTEEWGEWFQNANEKRIVKQEEVGEYEISTVFIGIDHNIMSSYIESKIGLPHRLRIFETMVFKDDLVDRYCRRCATWKEAEKQHEIAVNWVKGFSKHE